MERQVSDAGASLWKAVDRLRRATIDDPQLRHCGVWRMAIARQGYLGNLNDESSKLRRAYQWGCGGQRAR